MTQTTGKSCPQVWATLQPSMTLGVSERVIRKATGFAEAKAAGSLRKGPDLTQTW